MDADRMQPDEADFLDPELVQQFSELQETPAPDTWKRVTSSNTPSAWFLSPRFGLQVAATVALVAGFVALVVTGPTTDVVQTGNGAPPASERVEDGESPVNNQSRPLETVNANGATVADVRLVDGTRLRLSVPERFGTGLGYSEPDDGGPVAISGDAIAIEIRYGTCANEGAMVMNIQGSAISQVAGVVEVCRADELLVMTATVGDELTADELDRFDLRPIAVSGAYQAALSRIWPDSANCGNCAPWGPMVFLEANTVVNRTGPTSVTAVDMDSLVEVWSTNTGGFDTYLHGGPGGVYLEVTGGPFLKLDPASGQQQWALERDPEERDLAIAVTRSGAALIQSSFTTEGSERPPMLRRIDLDAGGEIWSAIGADGTSWHPSRPVEIDGMAVMVAFAENASPDGSAGTASTVWSFDLASGEVAWTNDLVTPDDRFQPDLLSVLDTAGGPVLVIRTADGIARLDPTSGALAWAIQVAGATVDGTDVAAEGQLGISLATASGQVIVDPVDGELLTPVDAASVSACLPTRPPEVPFVPPAAWPKTPSSDDFVWFGTDDLWTVIDREGHTPRKSVWWSANFPGGAIEERPELSVTYERLDSDDPPILVPAPGTNGLDASGDFMINGLEPDEIGCWLVTASYKGHSLSYVYEVG